MDGNPKPVVKKQRYPVHDDDDDQDVIVECSARSCKSCAATIVADCVALCCCPCAVVNFLTLTFVKVPWMVTKRCLGIGKRKRKMLEKKRKLERSESNGGNDFYVASRKELELQEALENGEEEKNRYSARFEAEKVWLELYQVGHLGFGRVSFTGISSLGKGS